MYCGMAKGTSQAEATLKSEKIKIIEFKNNLFDGIFY